MLVHELGHAFGLAHNCGTGDALMGADATRARLLDCTTARDRGTAMYPNPTESGRKYVFAPNPSERRALCELYPSAGTSCGCAFSQSVDAIFGVPVLLLIAYTRRSVRRRKNKCRAD